MEAATQAAIGVPASLAAFSILLHPTVLTSPGDLVAAVARAIDCELPAALGLPPNTAEELAQAALVAVVAHWQAAAAASAQVADLVRALHGSGQVGLPPPRAGTVLTRTLA